MKGADHRVTALPLTALTRPLLELGPIPQGEVGLLTFREAEYNLYRQDFRVSSKNNVKGILDATACGMHSTRTVLTEHSPHP